MASAAAGQVRAPWVRTDRSVDCRTRATILADILRPGMTDEQKAVAIWRFMVDHTWHFSRADSNTPMQVLNVYGYSLCGTLSRVQNWLRDGAFPPSYVAGGGCSRYGSTFAERRVLGSGWLIDSWERLDGGQKRLGSGRMGHSMGEVFYDGHWHFLDCHANFFVYTADKSRIAGYFDLCSDPTLVSDPVKTSEPFMPYDHGDPSFYYRFAGDGGNGIPDPAARPKEKPDPEHSMDVTLRPGETYVRTWQPIPGAFKWSASWNGQWDRAYIDGGPRHVPSGEHTWRRYASGWLDYDVPLASAACKAGIEGASNCAFGFEDGKRPAVHAADAGKPLAFDVSVASPYVLIRGQVTGRVIVPAGGSATISVEGPKGKPAVVWQSQQAGEHAVDAAFDEILGYGYGYRVHATVAGGGGVESLRVKSIFQLNPLTLPRLRPGENKVTVTCADPADLKREKLSVVYVWQETGGERSHVEPIDSSGRQFAVRVGEVARTDPLDPSYMRRLEVSCAAR